jgi:hypothetical protein
VATGIAPALLAGVAQAPIGYAPRDPATRVLHRLVLDHFETFRAGGLAAATARACRASGGRSATGSAQTHLPDPAAPG